MKFIDFEDALDRDLGKVGTPKRDAFESSVDKVSDRGAKGAKGGRSMTLLISSQAPVPLISCY